MENAKEPRVPQGGKLAPGHTGEANLLRPCPKHMSATERLRKVIQELVDTEKSYVKVRPPGSDCFGLESLLGSQHQRLIKPVPLLSKDLESCSSRLFFTLWL